MRLLKLGLYQTANHHPNWGALRSRSRLFFISNGFASTLSLLIFAEIFGHISAWITLNKNSLPRSGVFSHASQSKPNWFWNAEGNLLLCQCNPWLSGWKIASFKATERFNWSYQFWEMLVPWPTSSLLINSISKGLGKLSPDEAKIKAELSQNVAVIAEGIQSILRREGFHPYELLKQFKRHSGIVNGTILEFIDSSSQRWCQSWTRQLSPLSYTGYSM